MIRVDEMYLAVDLYRDAVLLATPHAERAGELDQLGHAVLLYELRQPFDDAARALYMAGTPDADYYFCQTVSPRNEKNILRLYFIRKNVIVIKFTGRGGADDGPRQALKGACGSKGARAHPLRGRKTTGR